MITEREAKFLETSVRVAGSIAVASGILFVAAFGSLSNSCNRPELVYYYTDSMLFTAWLTVIASMSCALLFSLKEFFTKYNDENGKHLERTFGKRISNFGMSIMYMILIAIIFGISLIEFGNALNVPMRDNPKTISVAEFCKGD